VARLRPGRSLLLRPLPVMLLLLAVGAAAFMQRDRIGGLGKCASTTAGSGDDQSSRASDTRAQAHGGGAATVDQTQAAATTQRAETLAGDAAFLSEYQAIYEKRGWNAPAEYLANLRAKLAETPRPIVQREKPRAITEAIFEKNRDTLAFASGNFK